MKHIYTSLIISFISIGCSSSNIKVECEGNKTYHIEYTRTYGNCGDIIPRDVSLPLNPNINCNVVINNKSLNGCSQVLTQDCSYTSAPALPFDNVKEHDVVSLYENPTSNSMTGTWNTTISFADGTGCVGTYSLFGVAK